MKTKLIMVLGILCGAAVPRAVGGEREGTVRARSGVKVVTHAHPMTPTPVATATLEGPPAPVPVDPAQLRIEVPTDPTFDRSRIRPHNPPSEVADPEPRQTAADGDFVLFQNLPLPSAAFNANTSPRAAEPSVGMLGRVAFYSGNWFASVSADYGQTFTFVNPFDNFPADGTNDAVNNGFCCDQVVHFDRRHGLFIWLLQYTPDANTNTQRIAFARSQEDVVNNNWSFADFTPSDFGFANSGFQLDFPDLTLSNEFLYYTTNIGPNPGTFVDASVVVRIGLVDMEDGDGSIAFSFFEPNDVGVRCTHGATSTMYCGSHRSDSRLRIHTWPESSDDIDTESEGHDGFTATGGTAPGPDGRDWMGFSDGRILGAYRADGIVGFMWTAAQDNSFSFPYVKVVRLEESTLNKLDEGEIFNNSFAYAYPSVFPNSRGHLGGTVAFGGGTRFPGLAAWIADDFSSTNPANPELVTVAVGNSGPSTNRWGDYFTTRLHVPHDETWVGTGFVMVGGFATGQAIPSFVWFGRERDEPPDSHTIYVDQANSSLWQTGSSDHAFSTVDKGHFAAIAGDTLIIQAGDYPESVTLDTQMDIDTEGGGATIGGD